MPIGRPLVFALKHSSRRRFVAYRIKALRRRRHLILLVALLVLILFVLYRAHLALLGNNIMDDGDLENFLNKAQPPVDPSSIHTVIKLNVPDAGLVSLPDALCHRLPNLSILFAPNNQIKELPHHIGSCSKLQMVSFKTNGMTSIHLDALQGQMRWLILTDNAITELPTTIGRCSNLQKLMLSGNELTHIPEEISNCERLELVRLASNQLTSAPMTLLRLPNLAWIALSANPFLDSVVSYRSKEHPPLPLLDDPVLDNETQGEILGQGASGVTRKVKLSNTYVAVKTYKGTMTSDGSPLDEKQIALVASTIASDCLIKVLGQTPQGSLVMELLHNVRAFGGPPSMESCSRDVYGDNDKVSEVQAKTMVTGLLEVLMELHQRGIMHGDLYGHNILVSDDDPTLVKLSDFGAAFFYDTDAEYGMLLQQIEMRAFGILVSEIDTLLGRVHADSPLRSPLNAVSEASRSKKSFIELQSVWKSHLEYM